MRKLLYISLLLMTTLVSCGNSQPWPHGQGEYEGDCVCYLPNQPESTVKLYPEDFDCDKNPVGSCLCDFQGDPLRYALSISQICKVLGNDQIEFTTEGSGRLEGEEIRGNMQGMREMCEREPESKLCEGEGR